MQGQQTNQNLKKKPNLLVTLRTLAAGLIDGLSMVVLSERETILVLHVLHLNTKT
jgi:hypothetical protein